MVKKFLYIFLLIILINSVIAIKFEENTTFNQNNIKYIFTEGTDIDTFDINNGGIKINGDNKFGLSIEGGELSVIFDKFDDNDKKISFISNVNQDLSFSINIDGVEHYLYDGSDYNKDSISLGTTRQSYDIITFEDNDADIIINNVENDNQIEKLSWYKQKLVEFEISKDISKEGIISSKTFAISYLYIAISIIVILFLIIVWSMIS